MTTTAIPPTGSDDVAAGLRAVSDRYAAMAELPVWSLTDATIDARMTAALAAQAAAADELVARVAAEADAADVGDQGGGVVDAGAADREAPAVAGGRRPDAGPGPGDDTAEPRPPGWRGRAGRSTATGPR